MNQSELKSKAINELKNFKFPNQDDAEEGVSVDGEELHRMFRCYDYFEARDGEEDDDWPDFVGKSKALIALKNHFSDDILLAYKISVKDNCEKSWFSVNLIPNK